LTASPPTLVLDLDGTLVDTAADLVGTLNAVLATEGLPALPYETAAGLIGDGARAMLTAGLVASGVNAEPERIENLFALYVDHYASHIADRSRAFDGAEAALDRFAEAGWRLAICTNKLEGLARRLLIELGIARRFNAIAGQDTFGVRKPDPRHLIETIRSAGGAPSRAVMVGDSIIDVKAAKAAHVPVIAVSFGYSAVPVAELGADAVIDRFADLFATARGLVETQSGR
jgi:phosphoglycolate phosphatase